MYLQELKILILSKTPFYFHLNLGGNLMSSSGGAAASWAGGIEGFLAEDTSPSPDHHKVFLAAAMASLADGRTNF